MEPLTPNTSALLDYISANFDPNNPSTDFLNTPADTNTFQQVPPFTTNPNPAQLPFSSSLPKGNLNMSHNGMPHSLPPSAFNMPVPGRDTPEATPESTNGAETSPTEKTKGGIAVGEDSDSDALVEVKDAKNRRKSMGGAGQGAGAQNKRKAGHAHKVEQVSDEEEDSDSEEQDGHEDKRPHPNDRLSPPAAPGKKGPRKSKGEDGQKPTKENKAARRKEQNRAAQKAFRERREAKVKDLEDHIAELEQKNKGQMSENDNLRQLLRTLQDENVRLKQSAFTFHVPVTGTSTPQSTNGTKAPSPPEQEPLRSIHDLTPPLSRSSTNPQPINTNVTQVQPPRFLQHRSSNGSSAPADSPQSMTSGTTASTSSVPSAQAHPAFDSADMFNAFASGVAPWMKTTGQDGQQQQQQQQNSAPAQPQQPSRQTSTSSSIPTSSPATGITSNNNDLQALWASFFPQSANMPATSTTPFQQANAGMNTAQTQGQFGNLGNADISPFNMFATSGNTADVGDKMAFRDTNAQSQATSQYKTGFTPGIPTQQQPQVFDWNNYNDDTGVNDFLASLNGGNTDTFNSFDPQDVSAEDEFTAQLQKLLDQSGTGAAAALNSPDQLFGIPGQNTNYMNFGMGMGNGLGNTTTSPGNNNAWSPSNYLNMSPFPSSGSGSASDSPSSHLHEGSVSLSNSASPEPVSQGGHMPMPNLSGASSGTNGRNANGADAVKPMSPNTTVVQVPAADPAGSKLAVQNVFAAAKRGDIVHVVDESGKVLKPSDVWVRMGMHHSNQVDNLLIDDLCDQMKQKATCQDGSYRLSVHDAERMFRFKKAEEPNAACPMNKSA